MYEREDWTLFRSLATLPTVAGVPLDRLRMLVVKELVDNALDVVAATSPGACRLSIADGTYVVEDDGPGLDGTPEHIARLFSIRRPLTSSKLLRLPTRGALGNGLRVAAGAVLASGGSLSVDTQGRRLILAPQDSGETIVTTVAPSDITTGTSIRLSLGNAVPGNNHDLAWGQMAIRAAGSGPTYRGKPSCFWYDSDSFFELLQAAPGSVRDVVSCFDGCTGRRASDITADFRGRAARELSRTEADVLLAGMHQRAAEVSIRRFATLGKDVLPGYYAQASGKAVYHPARGTHSATVPFTVEAWVAERTQDNDHVVMYVNRSPITGWYTAQRRAGSRASVVLYGCELGHEVRVGQRPVSIRVNIQTPYIPITSEGKEPDLGALGPEIVAVVEKAARRMQRKQPKQHAPSIKQVVLYYLNDAITQVSGEGQYRFSLRQLYYAMRPYVQRAGQELKYEYFGQLITEYEDGLGRDLPGIYRDGRGTLYHPHEGKRFVLGTQAVETYGRPEWTFNKILYCEKEGFFPILLQEKWPERHDCALLTSKGYASRAARDLFDLLGETDEPLQFFCIHDADAAGTMIYQTLQEATRARGRRKVEIVNLGLDPWEAVEMGLEVEQIEQKKKIRPVAQYIQDEDLFVFDDDTWEIWLQSHRIELNAMSTPLFLEWLDGKMSQYAGKVVPPLPTLKTELENLTRPRVREALAEEILKEAGIDQRVETSIARVSDAFGDDELESYVEEALARQPVDCWRDPLTTRADELAHEALAQ